MSRSTRRRIILLAFATLGCRTLGPVDPPAQALECTVFHEFHGWTEGVATQEGLLVLATRLQARAGTQLLKFSSADLELRSRAEVPIFSPLLLEAADLDGDDRLDLVVGGTDVVLGFEGPEADWRHVHFDAGPNSQTGGAARIADLDSDGRLEIVATDYFKGGSRIISTSFGAGGEPHQTELARHDWIALELTLGDVTGDGRTDVVTAAYLRAPGPGEIPLPKIDGPEFAERHDSTLLFVWPGDGSGGLGPAIQLDPRARIGSLVAADIEAGGADELLFSALWAPVMIIAQLDGEGLRTLVELPAEDHGPALAVADLDRDGLEDLITTGKTTTIFRQRPGLVFESWARLPGERRVSAVEGLGILLVGQLAAGDAQWCGRHIAGTIDLSGQR